MILIFLIRHPYKFYKNNKKIKKEEVCVCVCVCVCSLLSLLLSRRFGSMVQQKVQNEGRVENAMANEAMVSFTMVKPWVLVEALKANGILQFYKVAFGTEELGRTMHHKQKRPSTSFPLSSPLNSSSGAPLFSSPTSLMTLPLRPRLRGPESLPAWSG
jgi:hypothetical protein